MPSMHARKTSAPWGDRAMEKHTLSKQGEDKNRGRGGVCVHVCNFNLESKYQGRQDGWGQGCLVLSPHGLTSIPETHMVERWS